MDYLSFKSFPSDHPPLLSQAPSKISCFLEIYLDVFKHFKFPQQKEVWLNTRKLLNFKYVEYYFRSCLIFKSKVESVHFLVYSPHSWLPLVACYKSYVHFNNVANCSVSIRSRRVFCKSLGEGVRQSTPDGE